jgi:hypothetical protein
VNTRREGTGVFNAGAVLSAPMVDRKHPVKNVAAVLSAHTGDRSRYVRNVLGVLFSYREEAYFSLLMPYWL